MIQKLGKCYIEVIKESIVKRIALPSNEVISQISEETGITEATLYK
ncbi:hypothetical protein [Domibacillus aminovorans]|nr:hypothetical protein [Domibacillus aminovorans]